MCIYVYVFDVAHRQGNAEVNLACTNLLWTCLSWQYFQLSNGVPLPLFSRPSSGKHHLLTAVHKYWEGGCMSENLAKNSNSAEGHTWFLNPVSHL
jgi:hypothetical protein